MNVQVILNEDLPNLGRTGDVVKVRAGYCAQLPVAAQARGRGGSEKYPCLRASEAHRRAPRRDQANRCARGQGENRSAHADAPCPRRRGGQTSSAPFTNIDLERALRESGLDIERRKIHLPEPIKQLGDFPVRSSSIPRLKQLEDYRRGAGRIRDLPDMIKLYDFLSCPYGQKVRIVLAEKALTYDLINVDLTQARKSQARLPAAEPVRTRAGARR